MTDYLYSFSLALQTRLFLLSLGFGFTVGAVYDFFRAIRIIFGNKKWAYRLTDILYLITLGFLNFLFFLTFNEGEFRFFAFFGEALGFTVYFFTVGFGLVKYFEFLINALRRILTAIFKVLLFPFKKISEFICRVVKKHLKKPKKNKNISKYPLKVIHHLLYNLTNRNSNIGNNDEGSNENAE